MLPWEGVKTLGEPRSKSGSPLTSACNEEQGSAEQQESPSPSHGAGGRCSLLTWTPFITLLVLTPRGPGSDASFFQEIMPGHSVKVPGVSQEELCVLARC